MAARRNPTCRLHQPLVLYCPPPTPPHSLWLHIGPSPFSGATASVWLCMSNSDGVPLPYLEGAPRRALLSVSIGRRSRHAHSVDCAIVRMKHTNPPLRNTRTRPCTGGEIPSLRIPCVRALLRGGSSSATCAPPLPCVRLDRLPRLLKTITVRNIILGWGQDGFAVG